MSVQNKELFQKFIEFCDAQPKDKEINHYTFYTCAVGDFARSINEDIETFSSQMSFAARVLDKGKGNLYKKINEAGCDNELATYGGYTTLLKTYL